ncbi:MAG: EAL domain-containing protein [Elainellaceae cyanobacterium]
MTGIAEDITARIQAEIERDRFFNLSVDLLFIASCQGRFKRLNPSWHDSLGYVEPSLLDQSFLLIVHPDDRILAEESLERLNQGQPISEIEIRCRHQDGSYRWFAWSIVLFPQERLIYGAGRNISQRKQSEAQLVHETLHDTLTGLANRTCFMERLALAIRRCRRHPGRQFAVLFIDLDGFKGINDTLGHGIGDQLLIQVSRLLREAVRAVDEVARLGGDEFTILLEDVQSLAAATEIAEHIQTLFEPAFNIDHHEIFTSASIGIVMGDRQYRQVEDIVRDADIAMYRAKNNGKARHAIFTPEMYTETLHLVELETSLKHAILHHELELYYQPIINLQSVMALEGFEVLLRWNHPRHGLIPASEFIPIAEETGLISSIGEWVIQQACVAFSQWQQTSIDAYDLYLSINVSGRQLRETSLLKILDRSLEETQISPQNLKLEITESSLIQNTKIATNLLHSIQERGIKISLDDFGTGFSSLSYLHQFPIDTIKIDRSFVEMLDWGKKERSIVESIITLAHTLGIATVAEGIESQQQLKELQRLGCGAGQGFLFAPPMTEQELKTFLSRNRCKTSEGV